MALLGGLDGLDRTHVRTALDSIVTNNHRDDFSSHVNHLRSYALGSDRGLVNATFPRGGRPTRPSPYVSEVWTGLEYTAALGLAVIGERDRAARIVEETRQRHDGRTRNPFNEVECGNHYVRSMASFGLTHGWTRTVVDMGADSLTLDPVVGRWPVVVGPRIGHVIVTDTPDGTAVRYEPIAGASFAKIILRNRD